jgi:hypothetical protein
MTDVLVAIVVSIAIVFSAIVICHAITSFRKRLERVMIHSRNHFPSTIIVRTPDVNTIHSRVSRGGGGGEAFRLPTAAATGLSNNPRASAGGARTGRMNRDRRAF